MSAQSLQVITLDLPNPDFTNDDDAESYHRINSTVSFTYLTSFTLRTLSTNNANPGNDVSGLLYTPDLPEGSPCIKASAPYIPKNATRQQNLPDTDYDLIAIAPWLSPQCVQQYLQSARTDPVRGFLFFLPDANGTDVPPEVNDPVWGLGDGGAWKRQNDFPVYAVPGETAQALTRASAQYSGNVTDVPYGDILVEEYDPRDYIRLFVDIDTAGSGSTLPSLWVFLLVVLGILLAIIGLTSFLMHWMQRRRRQTLRRRVANGEVDLEALGIKRLTVPQEILNGMPLYTYGSGTPVPPTVAEVDAADAKLESAASTRPSSPLPQIRPAPAIRSTSFHPSPLQQPTCAICLDDFVPGGPGTEGTIVRELPCHHIFHPECIDAFLRDSSSLCPMCKKTVLPKGYCPRTVTNAMVRRERMVRRLQERAPADPDPLAQAQMGSASTDSIPPLSSSLGDRIRNRTFSGLSQLRAGRRISSAPPMSSLGTEMTPTAPSPALVRSSSNAPAPASARRQVQPPSTHGRREWARQRAVAMLGRRAPVDPDEEEQRVTPGWRKALRGVFPGVVR